MTVLTVRHGQAEALPELRAVLELACNKAQLLYHAETAWSSGAFSGARHTIQLCFTGIDAIAFAEAFIERLPYQEFALVGRCVMDAAIIAVERTRGDDEPATTITLQLLTLEN
ncbi:hypothetical protein [Novosphingobium album (ex Liu et al. 2023)]|uniref:Uncharacterized protein n=1 Tax=Novosphingobium album (ex Liu et al. 2023) TaxID=3031130 RepID=A0ABT5WXZ9_9SPHN|nr:hypothetical protein [Novosphingobium album (ex Liu et al. 2023)]MDE8654787.1 hypothetical protein [Novosphingobium album (ex Liu et al. 2023)]